MTHLVPCSHCESRISNTALRCPSCLKPTGDEESLSRKLGESAGAAAVVLLTGPAGIASALLTSVFSLDGNRQLKKEAKRLGCIDSFDLSEGILVFVTDREFVPVLTGLGSVVPYPGFARHHLRAVSIDEHESHGGGFLRSERTVLRVEYFDTQRRKTEVVDEYTFKGKGSRAAADLARLKFSEYRVNAAG